MAAVVVFVLTTLPPLPSTTANAVDPALRARTIAGAYHVHTTRSDGDRDPADVARAAARAGLRFLIFTDHGDGTRVPDPPQYRDGVLCVDAVEISTTGGHYVALGMAPAPYPLGGEPGAVAEDVARLGGFGIAAHPDSARAELSWTHPDVPIDGLEWLSADSEWRNESRTGLARVLLEYPIRPAAALASVLDRPVGTLAKWDALTATRQVVGLAALDAHGGMRGRVEGSPMPRLGIRGVPSYEASFESFAIRAVVAAPLTGRGADDAKLVLDALEAGNVFTAIDAVAGPAYLDFHAGGDGSRVEMGAATRTLDEPISARATVPNGAAIVLRRNGQEIARAAGGELHARAQGPGAYRLEIEAPDAPGSPPVPWVVSNPIYVDLPQAGLHLPAATRAVVDLRDCAWHAEKDPNSSATVNASPGAPARFAYELASGAVVSQFAALACDLPAQLPAFDRVQFRIRARGPSRVSVQLRFHRDGDQRLTHSVYAEQTARDASVPVEAMAPAERRPPAQPAPERASTVLFVVDLTNASPGTRGEFEISELSLSRLATSESPAARR